jgi:hypothetical protein
MAGGVLLANPAFAGEPVLVDGKGRAVVFDTASKQQKEWNAYVKVHGIRRGGYIYTPYSSKFHRGGSIATTRAQISQRAATSKIPQSTAALERNSPQANSTRSVRRRRDS